MNKAFLILEDGSVFEGIGRGFKKETVAEIVFNTSMTGYTEALTDPSYCGQMIALTYPLIGNYGVCLNDMESKRIWASALIVRELADEGSNFRRDVNLEEFLNMYEIPAIEGVDVRKIVKLLRSKGTMNGMITFDGILTKPKSVTEAIERIKSFRMLEPVINVSTGGMTYGRGNKYKIALVDLGTKKSIIDKLVMRGCEVNTFKYDVRIDDILKINPDGIILGNGPGDPALCSNTIELAKGLYDTEIPILGICLGHQIMALAVGAETFKMKFGHRGGNHPVRDMNSGRVYITSQNHGYVIDSGTISSEIAEASYVNVNDGSIEGLRYKKKRIRTVQFHPEACSGPLDTEFIFDEFINLIKEEA